MNRYIQALILWDWIQWRLPPSIWLEAQQVLRGDDPPPITDPTLVQGLNQLLDPQTTNPQKLQLVRDLLLFIRARSTDPRG